MTLRSFGNRPKVKAGSPSLRETLRGGKRLEVSRKKKRGWGGVGVGSKSDVRDSFSAVTMGGKE